MSLDSLDGGDIGAKGGHCPVSVRESLASSPSIHQDSNRGDMLVDGK